MKIIDHKYGFYIHLALGFFFLLGCYSVALADPISGFLVSLAISAAVSAGTAAATWGINKLMQPKPKPVDKNKLQGEIKLSQVGEDVFINEIYGGRAADGKGGVEVGVTIVYASPIRLVTQIVQASSSASPSRGKGGGGGAKPAPNKEHHYFTDLACLVSNTRGRILEIKAGTDVIYRNYPPPVTPFPPSVGNNLRGKILETVEAVYTNAGVNNNPMWSNGTALAINQGGTIDFGTVNSDGRAYAFYIYYYTDHDDTLLNITVAGKTQTVALPHTHGQLQTVMLVCETNAGASGIFCQVPGSAFFFDRIVIGEVFASTPEVVRFSGISGMKNYDYSNPVPTYDNNILSPSVPFYDDYRGTTEYNYQPNPNQLGETTAELPAGCSLRIYEGTEDQLPDPLLQSYFESKYGPNSTPAYRGRQYFVLENFEITKYGTVPNITVVTESLEQQTLGAMYAYRSKRAGLAEDEFDYSQFDGIHLRGYVIGQRQAPRTEIENLNRILDVDVYESNDGKIVATIPSDDVLVRIPASDLDAREIGANETAEGESASGLKSLIRNEYEMPKRLDLSYFNPDKKFEISSVHAVREFTVSEKRENIETSLVLTDEEAQKMVDRLHQKEWAEKDGESFTTFYRHGWIEPTSLIEVVDLQGSINKIRVKERTGAIPGRMEFVGSLRNLEEAFPRIFQEPSNKPALPPWVNVPAHVIGTIVDIASLRTIENKPGVYAACAMTDQKYQFKGASLMWERESGYELVETFPNQATFGRTVLGSGGVLPNVPDGWTSDAWDTSSQVTFDLLYGEVETLTDAEVLDRKNILVVGNEAIAFANATRVNGFPNRWAVSRLKRRLLKTNSLGHVSNERVLLLNDAVKFIEYDLSEYGIERNYKYISSGQDINSASSFTFAWGGKTNVFAPPPVPAITFAQENAVGRNGTVERHIRVNVYFGDYQGIQKAKVFWKKPGASAYTFYEDISPDANDESVSVIENAPVGINYIEVIAYSANDTPQVGDSNAASITVSTINTELETPVIVQQGLSTLTTVALGITYKSEKVRYRKIQQAANSAFNAGVQTSTVDLWARVNNNPATELITRTYSSAEETRWVRIAHSTDGLNFTPYSAGLQVTFKNESGDGVPQLADIPTGVAVDGDNWVFTPYPPFANGQDAKNLDYRLLDFSNSISFSGTLSATATSWTISDASNLPAAGKIAVGFETIGYTSKSGNTLNGLLRGLENTIPTNHPDSQVIYPVLYQPENGAGFTLEVIIKRRVVDVLFQYRWINGYRENGSDGWSQWSPAVIAAGTGSTVIVMPPQPPPPLPPNPPTEDPYSPPECFAPSESQPVYVWMADGSAKTIQDIKVGDLVRCEIDNRIAHRRVAELFRNRTEGFYNVCSDDVLPVTGRHKFKTVGGDIPARDLAGHCLINAQRTRLPVISNERVLESRATYNHEIEEAHNYFVRGDLNASWKLVCNMRAKDRNLFQ